MWRLTLSLPTMSLNNKEPTFKFLSTSLQINQNPAMFAVQPSSCSSNEGIRGKECVCHTVFPDSYCHSELQDLQDCVGNMSLSYLCDSRISLHHLSILEHCLRLVFCCYISVISVISSHRPLNVCLSVGANLKHVLMSTLKHFNIPLLRLIHYFFNMGRWRCS